jgi:SAM-dependent methyltransferase
MDSLSAEDNTFDRLFCLSVIEHVPAKIAIGGIQEMARILKPGGLAVITMDLCVSEDAPCVNPLTLVWESGLLPAGELNVAWPVRRLGHGFKRGLAADVYGLVLLKDSTAVEERYYGQSATEEGAFLERWQIPAVRSERPRDSAPLTLLTRMKLAATLLRRGYGAMLDRYSRLDSGNEG